jgi:hypothetical protein
MHCASSTVKSNRETIPAGRIITAGLVLNALLVLPAWWRDGEVGSVLLAPEAWLLPALVAFAPRGAWRVAVLTFSAALATFAVVAGFFDALVQSVLGRALNVFVDPLMLGAGFHLIEGSLGLWAAVLASVLLGLAVAALAWGLAWMLGRVQGTPGRGTAVILSCSVLLALPGPARSLPALESQFRHLVASQAAAFEQTREARAELLRATADPDFRARALPGLAGRDVYIVFIESYGASAVDQAAFSRAVEPLLRDWSERLSSAGLSAASGRLAAPIRGGQSWLSHATVLSGLSIDNPVWYRMLLERDIDLLSDDFRVTGHEALNVAPGIVMDWPEGDRLGFDRIYAAADLGYEGPRLGWVTMPDEYTLHAFSERIRPRHDGPVFAQIALISSHWPWRPVIEPIADHSRIDRGRVYASSVGQDAYPAASLFDPGRMRRAYVGSLRYSLAVTLEWARRHLPGEALLIVLGDHQPVSLVTGREAGSAVPVHVISGDRDVLAGFLDRGFAPGLLPGDAGDPPPMDRLRHWLRGDFGKEGHLP